MIFSCQNVGFACSREDSRRFFRLTLLFQVICRFLNSLHKIRLQCTDFINQPQKVVYCTKIQFRLTTIIMVVMVAMVAMVAMEMGMAVVTAAVMLPVMVAMVAMVAMEMGMAVVTAVVMLPVMVAMIAMAMEDMTVTDTVAMEAMAVMTVTDTVAMEVMPQAMADMEAMAVE